MGHSRFRRKTPHLLNPYLKGSSPLLLFHTNLNSCCRFVRQRPRANPRDKATTGIRPMHAIPYRCLAWPHDSTPKTGETPGILWGRPERKQEVMGHIGRAIRYLNKGRYQAATKVPFQSCLPTQFHALSLFALPDGGAEMPSSASGHDELNVA